MAAVSFSRHLELVDPLAYLQRSSILDYRKGELVYNETQPSTSIYLVIEGKVKITRRASDGRRVLADIYRPEDFFGESAFLRLPRCTEEARAIESSRLMSWTIEQIAEMIRERPELAIAFLQLQSQRMIEYGGRIEGFCWQNSEQRLVSSLLRFSDRLGTPHGDGSVTFIPMAHHVLAEYVGTSREVITQHMNGFRQQGYLEYSRRGIRILPDGLKAWRQQTAA